MVRVAVMSLKGGTGRTTLVANLGRVLAERSRVVLVDLDAQNALGLHFGMAVGEALGITSQDLDQERLAAFLRTGAAPVPYLPFGRPSSPSIGALAAQLRLDPSWLERRLASLVPPSCEITLMDTPAARGPWLTQALALADVVIVVLEACPLSYATLPEVESLLAEEARPRSAFRGAHFVLNRMDSRRALSRDLRESFVASLGDALVDVNLEDDEHVREAIAHRTTCIEYAPHALFSASVRQLAERLVRSLAP